MSSNSEADLFRPSWSLRLLRPAVIDFAWGLFKVLGRIRTHGRERVPQHGGVLILANHTSDCDPVAVQIACPRHVEFMAKSELFEMPSIRGFMRWWGSFPVRRGEPDRGALKHAIDALKAGRCVCIFPEGQLSETGELIPILPGAMLVARRAGCTVICLGLTGTRNVMPYGRVVPQFAWKPGIVATWGDPRVLDGSESNEELAVWTESDLRRLTGQNNSAPA